MDLGNDDFLSSVDKKLGAGETLHQGVESRTAAYKEQRKTIEAVAEREKVHPGSYKKAELNELKQDPTKPKRGKPK